MREWVQLSLNYLRKPGGLIRINMKLSNYVFVQSVQLHSTRTINQTGGIDLVDRFDVPSIDSLRVLELL